jgi:hypothetical protein
MSFLHDADNLLSTLKAALLEVFRGLPWPDNCHESTLKSDYCLVLPFPFITSQISSFNPWPSLEDSARFVVSQTI